MQGRSQSTGRSAGNVVSLCAWRSQRAGQADARGPAHRKGNREQAIRRLLRLQRDWHPKSDRLRTALNDLDDAVQDLGQSMSDLEGHVVLLQESLGQALTRLEAQQEQNAKVIACLDSGDLEAMEDCRRRIRRERCKAGRALRSH